MAGDPWDVGAFYDFWVENDRPSPKPEPVGDGRPARTEYVTHVQRPDPMRIHIIKPERGPALIRAGDLSPVDIPHYKQCGHWGYSFVKRELNLVARGFAGMWHRDVKHTVYPCVDCDTLFIDGPRGYEDELLEALRRDRGIAFRAGRCVIVGDGARQEPQVGTMPCVPGIAPRG